MSDVYIFLGPTLALTSARAELDAIYLPPVAEGDVYRLGRLRPRAVGIVDGFFDRVPAVWHKEIMWIMERGVYVFGSAEMGALRAVELEMFGMRGVGWVYQAFKDGTLEQDDEVALAHGSGSRGFRPLSEAMVNIRRTLLEAEHQKIICEITRELLTAVAKAFFYRDRNWTRLLEAGEVKGADSAELTALRQWLPDGRVDQKASDAAAMLREMRGFLATNPAPLQVRWRTANTNVWNAARQRAGSVPAGGTARGALTFDTVMDEIRLLGPACFEDARRHSLLRFFASQAAEREGMLLDAEQLREAICAFRTNEGLEQPAALAEYLAANDLSESEFEHLIAAEERMRWACARGEEEALEDLLDNLRLCGQYEQLVSRARDKAGHLGQRGLHEATPATIGQPEDEVLRWYFIDRLGHAVPNDLTGYARSSGFRDELALRKAVWREFCYLAGQPSLHEDQPEGRVSRK